MYIYTVSNTRGATQDQRFAMTLGGSARELHFNLTSSLHADAHEIKRWLPGYEINTRAFDRDVTITTPGLRSNGKKNVAQVEERETMRL